MPRKSKRQYHHGDLKQALINAALKLVREKGPRGFTLNEASRSAGVSVSAPYNHFKDKDALLIEIVLLGNRILKTELEVAASRGRTDRDKLLAVFESYIDFASKHADLFTVMFQSGINKQAYPEVRTSAEKAFRVGLDIASRLEDTPGKAFELAMAVWTMAHGFAMLNAETSFTIAPGISTLDSKRNLGLRLFTSAAG